MLNINQLVKYLNLVIIMLSLYSQPKQFYTVTKIRFYGKANIILHLHRESRQYDRLLPGRQTLFPQHAGYRPADRRHQTRRPRSEEHTSELQSRENLVCRLLLEKKK